MCWLIDCLDVYDLWWWKWDCDIVMTPTRDVMMWWNVECEWKTKFVMNDEGNGWCFVDDCVELNWVECDGWCDEWLNENWNEFVEWNIGNDLMFFDDVEKLKWNGIVLNFVNDCENPELRGKN